MSAYTESARVLSSAMLALGLGALIWLAMAVAPVVAPAVLASGLLFLLFPLRRNLLVRRMLILVLLLLGLWFFYSLSGFALPLILALLFVYIVNPVVTWLDLRGVPRWVSSLACVAVVVGVTVGVFVLAVPRFVSGFNGIDSEIRGIIHDLSQALQSGDFLHKAESVGVPADRARSALTGQIAPGLESVLVGFLAGISGYVTAFGMLAGQAMELAFVPFVIFFLLTDMPKLVDRLVQAVPPARREHVVEIASRLDVLLGRYFRGAIAVAAIQGAISATGLWLIGVKSPVALGVMTGFLDFFPYVGLFISLVVSALVAYSGGGAFVTQIILITMLYLSQKLLEATVLAPRIIGPHVGLHPVLLILSLFLFEQFLGFAGLLIAVPAGAIIVAATREWERQRGLKFVTEDIS